jgi:FMN phosphatase YigB (HAD superfamily)
MSRPLLISDCDEVLLHMAGHFADWIDEAHGLELDFAAPGLNECMVKDRTTGRALPDEQVWPLLDTFFVEEWHRQNVVPGAVEALTDLSHDADIVILTNLPDRHQALRIRQLETFEIRHEVLCNAGPKGPQVKELVERLRPSVAVFVDDHAPHHRSAAEHAPQVWRLHMIAEARLAAHVAPAADAHARIDSWADAHSWIRDRFAQGPPPAG